MNRMLKPSAQRVQDALLARGFPNRVIELPDTTRTAAEAAAAVGCTVGQIAKSLIFAAHPSGRAVLVIASGAHRVNEKLIASHVGEALHKPDAGFVRQQTGFVIGGAPPVGHEQPLLTLLDQELWRHTEIWAAAGHPNAVFKLTPDELAQITGGAVIAVQ
jgi:prolyl-tRNA editing enzyme YbaK/EbsC (Cys-tRNA(Pro) deacylase)